MGRIPKYFVAMSLGVAPVFAQDPPPGCGDISIPAIVYTRQPMATTPIPSYGNAANWQHASDVGRINAGIAEADVVIDDLMGNVKVIHNCTTSPEICVAQEARVSPDGTKIAYSVGYGSSLSPLGSTGLADIPEITSAQIFIYDIAKDTSTPIPNHPAGAIDRQPEWLDNDTLLMSSNRQNVWPFRATRSEHEDPTRCANPPYCVAQEYPYGNNGKSMQIWRMKVDGTQAVNLTPHEQMALSPLVMTNGDILFSCWQANENKPHGTVKNHYWLCRTDGNGADETSLLNGHTSGPIQTTTLLANNLQFPGEGYTLLKAVRSVAEIFKGKLAVTNYYRGNHTGSMGIVVGFNYHPHVEGSSANAYTPNSLHALTPYGTDQDMMVRLDGEGRPMGKDGYAAPWPGSQTDFILTHARGSCYEQTQPSQTVEPWLHGEPTCQKAIYRVKVPVATDPFDPKQMQQISKSGPWQAYDGHVIAPYSAFYGQDLPAKPAPLTDDRCYLQSANARMAELQPARPYDWIATLPQQCSVQGCAVNTENPSFYANTVDRLRILLPAPFDFSYLGNQARYVETRNTWGYKSIQLWGERRLETDGSVKMEVPCETPLLMAGADATGMSLAHDSMLHSLRKGETRTCAGCHFGHSYQTTQPTAAVDLFATTLAAKTDGAPTLIQRTITWRNDVADIVARRCASCHMPANTAYTYSAWVWDDKQIDFPGMKQQPTASGTQLVRPYTSKYVAKFARDSLMYWKCLGSRQDGRTDAQYANDIDFGAAHNSGATAQECRTIGQWIDSGAQY
jgi:hypothetical protein